MKCMEIYRSRYEPCNRAAFVFDLQRFAGGERTEEPTPKKRADARKKGQVGRSQELNTAFVLLIGFFFTEAPVGQYLSFDSKLYNVRLQQRQSDR